MTTSRDRTNQRPERTPEEKNAWDRWVTTSGLFDTPNGRTFEFVEGTSCLHDWGNERSCCTICGAEVTRNAKTGAIVVYTSGAMVKVEKAQRERQKGGPWMHH